MNAHAAVADDAAEKLVAMLAQPVEHADGIYFGLDEEPYHADLALGSTDMGKLTYDPTRFWFESGYNEGREAEEKTDAQERGAALHCFVLFGRAEFEARYAPAYENGNTKDGRAERAGIAAAGKTCLRARDYERIMRAGVMITANPYLGKAFSQGHAEVSVFWTRDGIRRKARFDYLKRRSIVDLKSCTNTKRIDFEAACCRAIDDYGYLTQAEHYREARDQLQRLAYAGAVFGDVDREWLRKVAVEKAWAWIWVFWQTTGAPGTWACQLSKENAELRDEASIALARAEENFRKFMDRFGPHEPWVWPQPIRELDISDLRSLRRR